MVKLICCRGPEHSEDLLEINLVFGKQVFRVVPRGVVRVLSDLNVAEHAAEVLHELVVIGLWVDHHPALQR